MSNNEYPSGREQMPFIHAVSFERKLGIMKSLEVGCMNTDFSTRISSRNATLRYTALKSHC